MWMLLSPQTVKINSCFRTGIDGATHRPITDANDRRLAEGPSKHPNVRALFKHRGRDSK